MIWIICPLFYDTKNNFKSNLVINEKPHNKMKIYNFEI